MVDLCRGPLSNAVVSGDASLPPPRRLESFEYNPGAGLRFASNLMHGTVRVWNHVECLCTCFQDTSQPWVL